MKRFPHLQFALCTLGVMTAGLTAIAQADSYDTISQAVLATLHERSYHMSMTTPGGQTAEADFVSPDRMHMTMPMGESTVIGKTVYLKMNGVWKNMGSADLMPSPVDAMKKLAAARSDTKVDDLGIRTVDGGVMHAYKVTNAKRNTVATVFIDSAGRIAREEIGTSVVRMSKFGEAVSIAAPI
jgi:hypothetical protein